MKSHSTRLQTEHTAKKNRTISIITLFPLHKKGSWMRAALL